MKLIKPGWVSHDGLPIFSVDIHPDGSRFATGGQGEDSGRIVIWNMAPVCNEDYEKDEAIPKMLCQMDNHLACVNCVRWSSSGRFLASGGDDKLVMVWNTGRYQTGSTVFGSGGKCNVETWRCNSTLRGHNGDVLDLAWSPNDIWLASCSVDNTIIVWNALKMPEIVSVLKGHTGLVKGVVWDPVGKYLASQSDDKTLRIWRTADWKSDAVIQEPFEECGGTTHVLRLSWSPDGLYLVSAHAMNGGGPTAQIIEREGWRQDKDFVGHRKAVTCVRFNSNILQKSYKNSSKPQQYCCCAIGSRDRSLSVWLTSLKRPLCVVHDLFNNSVLDLSWSTSGLQLMACSWDGTVAYIEFSSNELGKCLTAEEKNSLHERMYGKSLNTANNQLTIIESAELLDVLQSSQTKTSQALPANQVKTESIGNHIPSSPMKGPINKQIETRTSDGKRRITPMYIPPTPDFGDVPAPFGSSGSQPTFSSSTETKSSIIIEKRDDIVTPNVSVNYNKTQLESKTVLDSKIHIDSCDGSQKLIASPSDKASRSVKVEERRTLSGSCGNNATAPITVLKRRAEHDLFPESSYKKSRESGSSDTLKKVRVSSAAHDVYFDLALPAASMGKGVSFFISDLKQRIDINNNGLNSALGMISTIRCISEKSENEDYKWEVLVGVRVCAADANSHVVAVACDDANLHVFTTKTGQRFLPPIVLSARASRLKLGGKNHLMVLTSCGSLNVWNLAEKTVVIKNESLLPIIHSQATSIINISLSDMGIPTLVLSNGKAYIFSRDLGSWLSIADSEDPVRKLSCHPSLAKSGTVISDNHLPLISLQSHIPVMRAPRIYNESPQCTVTYLEQQVIACQFLQSKQEYRYWLLAFVKQLSQEGLEQKLRLICNELLGPSHGYAHLGNSWEKVVMGYSKHELLKEVLKIMKGNLQLQRLYLEYNSQLNSLEENKKKKEDNQYELNNLLSIIS